MSPFGRRSKPKQHTKLIKDNAQHRKFRHGIRDLFGASPVNLTGEQKVSLLYFLHRSGNLTERDLHAVLSNFFAQREIALAEPIIADDTLGFEFIRDFYRLRLLDYNMDDRASHQAVAELLGRAGPSFLRGKILTLFFQKAVVAGAIDSIEEMVDRIDDQELLSVSRGTIMGICRLFISVERLAFVSKLLTRYLDPNRADQLLYYLELLFDLGERVNLPKEIRSFCADLKSVSTRALLQRVAKVYRGANDDDKRNFQHFVVEPLLALPQDERNLMNVRFSPAEREALLKQVQASVLQRQPLSLIRLGDGESYPYPVPPIAGINATVFENDDRSQERHWWGSAPSSAIRDDIKTRVRQAVARCDILGVPSVYRVIRDLPLPDEQYGKNRSQRSLMRVIGALGSLIPFNEKTFTEERCHRTAITAPFLVELAGMSARVVLVSCWPELQSSFQVARVVDTILIPAQFNLLERASDSRMPPLFETYPDVIERVRAASHPGTLVLVGAGIIGKILVDEARQCGAVALDVGSLLDYMVGLKTRSVAEAI
jgi:hypothetical protein